MKTMILVLAGVVALGAGCATTVQTTSIKNPVGAPPGGPALIDSGQTHGHLVVYSVWDFQQQVDYDQVARAPYEVRDADGALVRRVFNDAGGYDRRPVVLDLRSGEYDVTSFVPGIGQTSVSVSIEPGQTTRVYLDGSGKRQLGNLAVDRLVFLPDGGIAGWKANADSDAGQGHGMLTGPARP